jgi:hypothetical protein
MQISSSNSIFQTSDFPLVVTLSVWFPIESVDRTDYQRASFAFCRNKKLDELVAAFYSRELNVEPQAFYQAMKTVKSRLYDGA